MFNAYHCHDDFHWQRDAVRWFVGFFMFFQAPASSIDLLGFSGSISHGLSLQPHGATHGNSHGRQPSRLVFLRAATVVHSFWQVVAISGIYCIFDHQNYGTELYRLQLSSHMAIFALCSLFRLSVSCFKEVFKRNVHRILHQRCKDLGSLCCARNTASVSGIAVFMTMKLHCLRKQKQLEAN